MAIHYESHVGSICGSTNSKRANDLQSVLNGERAFMKQCHMRGPQARLLFLKGVIVKLEQKTYETNGEALKAEFNSPHKKESIWEELMELVEDRIKTVGKPPESIKYVLRFLAVKGDIYTRSYLNRVVTEKEDRDYINKFFDLKGYEAL